MIGLLIAAWGMFSMAAWASGWSGWQVLGPHTAVGLLVLLGLLALGVGLAMLSRSRLQRSYRTFVFPGGMGLLVALTAVLLWFALEQQQRHLEQRARASEQGAIATALHDGMEAQVTAIRRVAIRFSSADEAIRQMLFAVDATQYLRDLEGLQALGYVDRARVLRLIRSRSELGMQPGMPMATTADIQRTFDAADSGEVQLSEPLHLPPAGEGALIVAPVRSAGETTGYVVGLVQFDRLFRLLLASHDVPDLRISQGNSVIFSRGTVQPAAQPLTTDIDLYGKHWQVDLDPYTARVRNYLPLMVLLVGFVLAALLTIALRLSALARERARQAEASSRQLHQQMIARTQAQEALAAAQRDLSAVLESIADGVFMVDAAWCFTYVNPQAARMIGSEPDILAGQPCWTYLPGMIDEGAERGALHQAWQQAVADGEPVTLQGSHMAGLRWYELRAYPHDRGLTVYMQDVSLRKRQERELIKRDAESRHAQQLAQLGSWEFHIRSGDLHWSAETCAIFGVERSPGEGGIEGLRERVHADDWAILMEAQDRLFRGDGSVEVQYRVVRPDGEQRVIHQIGELLSNDGDPLLAGAVQDVTERQRTEAALRQTTRELAQALEATRLVMDSAPDVIVVLDREGHFRQISAAAERIWGYPPESLIGQSIARVAHPDDREAMLASLAGIVDGRSRSNFRHRNLARDGRILHMQWSGAWSAQSDCLYVVGRDQSELHRAEMMDVSQRRILTSVASGQPIEASLESIVLAYEAQYPEALCSILLLNDGRLYHGAAPHLPRQYMDAIDGIAIGPEVGSCGTAAWRRERVVVEDIGAHPLWENYASLALSHDLLACWSTPIHSRDGTVLGTFAVYHAETRGPTEDELRGVDSFAALAAIAIEHERAFRRLSESEQRFRSLFDYHPDGVFALDSAGRVQQANPAGAVLLGETPAELQGKPLARHAAAPDRVRTEQVIGAAAGGEPGRLALAVDDGCGGQFPGQLMTIPIVVKGESRGVFAVLHDQRELHQAQQAMAGQLALLAAVADSVGEGLLAVDSAGEPTFLNRMASRLLGLPAYSLPAAAALPEEVGAALAAVLSGAGYVTRDDTTFSLGEAAPLAVSYVATPLRIEGELAGAVLAFRDIGSQKEAQRTLSERQKFFELSLEVFCIFDASSGRFLQVNPAFCRLLGYPEEAFSSFSLEQLVHPQDLLATLDATAWQWESGEPLSQFVNRMRCADGHYVWLEWASRRAPEGLIFAVARDVTAKREADASLAQAMDDLRIRNRELQDFAYVASHDLQEPLRKIQAFSDRLQSRLLPILDASSRDYLQRMGDAASRMQTLIDDLLAYSRVGTRAASLGDVDLSAELATVLDDLDTRVQEAGAEIVIGPLPTLQADASQMRQLFQNLLANALKFRATERPCRIEVSAQALGEGIGPVTRWEIRVCDNGIGFDSAYSERIFAPFQRLHPRNVYSGTGIGLAIVRRIVERHGGTVHAESERGKGTTFFLRLPVRAADNVARVASDAPLISTDSQGAGS